MPTKAERARYARSAFRFAHTEGRFDPAKARQIQGTQLRLLSHITDSVVVDEATKEEYDLADLLVAGYERLDRALRRHSG